MKRLRYIVFSLLLIIISRSYAAPKVLPTVTTTEGREFFVAWLPNGGSEPKSADLKLQLAASSREANTIVVEYPGGATQNYPVAKGGTAWITVDPQTVYWDPENGEEETPLAKGIRVYSANDQVFTLYSINQYGVTGTYSFDGAHILPVEALGTEYMVQTADADAIATEFVVMSTKPGQTNVTMKLKVNSRRGNTQELNVTLNGSKQIYIVRSKAPNPDDPKDFIDLSGSTICADQPIAVWSGNQYAVVPNQDGMNNDHAYDQLLPLNRWGKTFLVPMTACNTLLNILRIVALQDNTTVQIMRGTNVDVSKTMSQGEILAHQIVRTGQNPPARYVTADKPIQVYLYSSSAGANGWYDEDEKLHVAGDPSMTMIPPLEYMTDTTIFTTYNGGDGQLDHQVNLWALSSKTATILLDGNPISTTWNALPGNTAYSYTTVPITHGTHTLIAKDKCFSGYAYGINDGQAYLYPVGYDFTPKKDSLFLLDQGDGDEFDSPSYDVRQSEWQKGYISSKEDGWYLDKILLDDNTYLLDSIYVCDSTELTFPIKTYQAWFKTRWEIKGTIQGESYFTPVEQLSENVSRPELTHQFTLLPIEKNNEPFEDFEVRGIVIRKPIICDIPEEKWERDTFNTIVRVLRQYNDTVWKAICKGDTVHFFRDTVWKTTPIPAKPIEGTDYILQETVFNWEDDGISPAQVHYLTEKNSWTRHYISSGGCDSLSTLMLYVCEPHDAEKDTVICKDGMKDFNFRVEGNPQEFFLKYRPDKWPIGESTLYDTLRAKACMNNEDFAPFKKHCPKFNGCDSVLKLHLVVKDVINNFDAAYECVTSDITYEWYEKNSNPQRLIGTFNSADYEKGKEYYFRDTVQYTICKDCPKGGCDSVRNTLMLMFIDNETQHHTQHVCQGTSYEYKNLNTKYTFNATGERERCGSYMETLTVLVRGTDGKVLCEFQDEVTFVVDTVYKNMTDRDTVCWAIGNNATKTYAWEGHDLYQNIPITKPAVDGTIRTFNDVLPQKQGVLHCDSACVLELTLAIPYYDSISTSLCDNDTLRWQDTIFYGKNFKGDFPANIKGKHLVTANLETSRDTVSRFKCDSVYKLHIDLYSTDVPEIVNTEICAGEIYDFYGEKYNTSSWTQGEIKTLSKPIQHPETGCIINAIHNIMVNHVYPDEWEKPDTVCQVIEEFEGKAYYEWPGADHDAWNALKTQSLNTPGSYDLVDPLTTVKGCDSIIHRKLVILPKYYIPTQRMMSNEDTIHWEKRIYAGEFAEFENPDSWPVIICNGIKEDEITTPTKGDGSRTCDSTRHLTLLVGQVFRDTVWDATCVNCGTCNPYNWIITSPITGKDTVIPITDLPKPYEERFYYDSLKTSFKYDSIYVLRLTGYPSYDFTEDITAEVCQGNEYTWTGHMGTDNGVQHRLFIDGKPITTIPTDTYGSFTLTDSMRTDTIYTNPKTHIVKKMSCDSVWTRAFIVHPTYNDRYVLLSDPENMSSNDTLVHFTQPKTLFVGYDFDYNATGVSKADFEARYDKVVYIKREEGTYHRDSVQNPSQFGCDSVHYIELHICETKYTTLRDTIADNDSTWYFGGDAAWHGGARAHTLPLVTWEKFRYYDDGKPVKYDSAENRTMREYFFIDTLQTASGCDSIVHDYVYVFPAYRFQFDTAVCANERYKWRKYDYLNRTTEPGDIFYDSINYTVGTYTFDSVYVLDLTVIPAGYFQFDTMLCITDTFMWHQHKIYYQSGGMTYVEVTYKDEENPCGNVYRMYPKFMPVYRNLPIDYAEVCEGDEFHWFSEGKPVEHTRNLRDGKGNKLDFIPTDVAGEYIYYDSLYTDACKCDSIHELHLTVKKAYHFYDTTFVYCSSDTLKWHDSLFYYQGKVDVYDTLFNASTVTACDSNYYMHVHFNIAYDITDTVFLCSSDGPFQWEDIDFADTLTAARHWYEPRHYDFARVHPALYGCDSVRRLDLTIAPVTDTLIYDTICYGDTLTVLESIYTQAGEYADTTTNQYTCDSVIFTHLTLIPPTVPTVWVEKAMCDNDKAFEVLYTYTSHFPIAYSLYFDSVGLSVGFEDMIDVPVTDYTDTMVITVPIPYASDDRTSYPRPDNYGITLVLDNGICQHKETDCYHDSTLVLNYPEWLTEQRHGDLIALLDSAYNGGYKWTEYQWYENDSILLGQTKPYLYIPTGLKPGAEYYVELTRHGETKAFQTCPILAIPNPVINDYAPTMGYLSVTPTCIVTAHPYVNILSRKDGTYRISNTNGQLVSEGVFHADVTQVEVPAIEGMYIFQLWSNDTPEEPYRAIKILVSEQCPNCDISSF